MNIPVHRNRHLFTGMIGKSTIESTPLVPHVVPRPPSLPIVPCPSSPVPPYCPLSLCPHPLSLQHDNFVQMADGLFRGTHRP
jgi:hypothetical protein